MNGKKLIDPPLDASWRSAWLPPPELSVDQWAEQSIILPRSVAAEPGPLSLDRTPYLREILQATQDPEVEEITMMTSTQMGKTLSLVLTCLHCLDADPWPCLHVMPREEDAVSVNVDRYQKIIWESPVLRKHLTGAANDMTREAIRLNGATLTFAGSNSPAGLASRAIAILVLDETDKYPQYSGREADPIALARERTRTFANRKILKTSSPTTERGYIYQEYLASDRRHYWVPCPLCNHYQLLAMGSGAPDSPGIHWPEEERDPERILDQKLAWYECEACHGRLTDIQKPPMLKAGVWVPESQTLEPDGTLRGPTPPRRRLGYHLPCLYSPWLSWSRIAAEFLNSKNYPSLLQNFRNSWLAEVWEDRVHELKGEHIRVRQANYQQPEVPAGVHVVTAGVDVQADHLWYVIRGWGAYGESWLIRYGQVPTFDALARFLFHAEYKFHTGTGFINVRGAFIDSGYRTDEVYKFCDNNPQAFPLKGAARPQRPIDHSYRLSATGDKLPLYVVDTDYFKSKMHRLIALRDSDPGAWHIPRDIGEDYILHMTAEQQVKVQDKKTGRVSYDWRLMHAKGANHLFDAEIYALAAAEDLNVEHCFIPAVPNVPIAPDTNEIQDETPRIPARTPHIPVKKRYKFRKLPSRSFFK